MNEREDDTDEECSPGMDLAYEAEELSDFLKNVDGSFSLETERGLMELETAFDLIANLEDSILKFKRAYPSKRDQKMKELSLAARHGDSEAALNLLKMLSGEEI